MFLFYHKAHGEIAQGSQNCTHTNAHGMQISMSLNCGYNCGLCKKSLAHRGKIKFGTVFVFA